LLNVIRYITFILFMILMNKLSSMWLFDWLHYLVLEIQLLVTLKHFTPPVFLEHLILLKSTLCQTIILKLWLMMVWPYLLKAFCKLCFKAFIMSGILLGCSSIVSINHLLLLWPKSILNLISFRFDIHQIIVFISTIDYFPYFLF
jgi:hypothetical protein